MMAVDIPLYGEESFVADLDEGRISGSLTALAKNARARGLFDILLRFLVYRRGLEKHRAADCQTLGVGVFRCDSMTIEKRDKEVLVSFEGGGGVSFADPDGFYRRVRWTGPQGASLELFADRCRG